jgi:signal peptidase I
MSNLGVLTRFLLLPLSVSVAAALIARVAVVHTYSVPSASMEPTLEPGDHIVVTPFRGAFNGHPEHGDVVVFRSADRVDQLYVKRVIAGPGDVVELREGYVFLNGERLPEPYTGSVDLTAATRAILDEDQFFVMGDNRGDSVDSRVFGPVHREQMIGKARLIFWSAGPGDFEVHAQASRTRRSVPRPHPVRWSRLLAVVR